MNIALIDSFKIKKENLGQIFGLSLIFYALLIITVLLFTFGRNARLKEDRHVYSEGITLANFLAQFAQISLERGRQDELSKVIYDVTREKELAYCIVMDSAGNRIVSFGNDFLDDPASEQITQNVIHSDYPLQQKYQFKGGKQVFYDFSKPVFSKGSKIGVVQLGMMPQTGFIFENLKATYALQALLIIFIAFPVFYYLFRRAIRPLSILQGQLKEIINDGQFRQLSIKQKGEAGEIADQVNQAVACLLEKYNVDTATRKDLEVSNSISRYEKKRIETMLEHLSDGIIAISVSRQILYLNKNIENILDIARTDVMGCEITASIRNEAVVGFIKEARKKWERLGVRKAFVDIRCEQTLSLKDKGIFCFVFSQMTNADGDLVGELLVVSDVTDKTMAEQAKNEFISHVAHEIKSPLNTIRSYVEMLMDGEVKDLNTQKEFYNVVTLETTRLSKLIDDLLNMSKIEMGSLVLNKGMVKPTNLLETCIGSVLSQAAKKNIQIEKLYPDTLAPLDIDKDLMGVAVSNILSNALKYTAEGGKIMIQANEETDCTVMSFRDTGCGMSEEDLAHIFEKFYRSESQQVQEQKGTGLGLAFTRDIVALHGGKIKAESTLGEGSFFTLVLPRAENFEHIF